MSALVSRIGAYFEAGDHPSEDVFYYCTESADLYLEVNPRDRTARIVHSETREGWKALGLIHDPNYDHVITADELARHIKIAGTAMLRGQS